MPAMAAQQPPKKAADAPKGTGAQASAPQKKENGGLVARLRDLPQAAGIAILALLLVISLYYIVFGFAFSRLVYASVANSVFDRYLNPRIEGAPVGMGLRPQDAEDELDDDEDDEEDEEDE